MALVIFFIVIALWRDPDALGGIGVWAAKGLPVLEAVIDRGSIPRCPWSRFGCATANMRSPSKHRLLVLRTRDVHCARRARRIRRELIRPRTGEGRKRAKKRGMRFGRPPKLNAHQRREALAQREAGETLMDIARSYASAP